MEILQLRYFFESARTESFAKTAEKYMVPLSSVSASIKRLEKELNTPLFNRHSNRVSLNENGIKLQSSLCRIFDELDSVVGSLTPREADKQEIKISVRALRRDIADYIIEYSSSHKDLSFRTIFNFNDENEDDYDIIIDDKPERYPDHESFELCSKRICLLACKDHPLCAKQLRLKDLCKERFISTGENTSTHKALLRACQNEGFTPNFAIYANDLFCWNQYVEAGIGIGVGRKSSYSARKGDLKELDVVDLIERQTVFVFYRDRSPHKTVLDFVRFLKSKAQL